MFSHEFKAEFKAEGIAEGKAEGIAEAHMSVALVAFSKRKKDQAISEIVDMLKELDIPDEIIECARKQVEDAKKQLNENAGEPSPCV